VIVMGHLRMLVRRGFASAAALLAALALGGTALAAAPAGTVEIDDALFATGHFDGRFGDRSQRRVSLPHAWAVSDPAARGDGWYTLRWTLDALPTRPQALCLTALLVPTEVFVNGELVAATGALDGRSPRSYEQSRYVDIPAGLLREGLNHIAVHVRAPSAGTGGLGSVLVGDATPLRERAREVLFVHTIGPGAVSIATLTVGVFIFVLWLRRREPGYLMFSVAVVLWSLHTLASLAPQPLLPQPHWTILWTATYLVFASLLCLFSIRYVGVRWPLYERFVVLYAVAALPILYAARAFDALAQATGWERLGGIILVIIALAAVARYALRRFNAESALLLAAGSISAVFAVHDWLAAQDPLNLRPVWLVPYAALAFLTLFGYLLTDRFVRALNDSEELNVELERRVEEKGAALTAQLQMTREARDAAEAANRAKSSFLAAASHDLRQPLHALGMFSEALAEHTHDTDGKVLVQRITTSVSALEALLSALLDVSKLDAGTIVAHPRDFAIRPLLDRLADECMPEALERGLSLAVVCGDVVVRSDPLLLERILRNLVANALRYTETGGVIVGCRRRGHGFSLEVWDSGEGIPAAEIERIFDEFYQVDSAARDRTRGLGLGLAIVRRLSQLLAHDVTVASRPGRGSVFRVAVPAGDASAIAAPAVHPLALDAVTGKRVLIVDDESEVREATARLLRQWGYSVVAVPDHAAAEQAFRADLPPDAMVVDYRLAHGAKGLELIASLRERFGPVPAVLVSGASSADDLARIELAGMPLLHKPVPAARLRSVLAQLVRSAETAAPAQGVRTRA
jgi:signal transduction histidine kinase/ActR/RegA family two-component response regulator